VLPSPNGHFLPDFQGKFRQPVRRMKLATTPEAQRFRMEQRRQIKALRTDPNIRGNPESEYGLAKQQVLVQKPRPKSKL
jgi:hypothetical protein